MITCSDELACQRERLIARCATQRMRLTVQGQAVVQRLSAFDSGLALFKGLKNHPLWMAGLLVGLIAIKPRRLLLTLQTGLLAWQAFRTLTLPIP